MLGACLVISILACLSNPGIITPENYAKHAAFYTYDGVVSQENQQCLMCMWKRPARSKHCNIVNRYRDITSS